MSLKNDLFLAFRSWCMSNGLTPEIGFRISGSVGIPVWAAEDALDMVLNVSDEATRNFMSEDGVWLFAARFGGAVAELSIPVGEMFWIRARGTQIALSVPKELELAEIALLSDTKLSVLPKSEPRRPKIIVERND